MFKKNSIIFPEQNCFHTLRTVKKMISSNSMEPNSLTDCWTAKVYNRKSSKWIWLIEFHRVIFSPLWGGLTGRYHFWIDPSKLFSAYQNKTVHYGSLGLKLHLHRPNVVLDNMTTFYRNIHLSINYRLTIHYFPDVTFDVCWLIRSLPSSKAFTTCITSSFLHTFESDVVIFLMSRVCSCHRYTVFNHKLFCRHMPAFSFKLLFLIKLVLAKLFFMALNGT